MVYLNTAQCHPDFECPYCKHAIEVEWSTEYGDPLDGDNDGRCPCCGKTINFTCNISVSYSVEMKSQ